MNMDLLKDLASQLATAMKEVPVDPSLVDLDPWRDRIDAIDRLVIMLLNERAACATQIGTIKKHLNLPVYTPSREEEVLENVLAGNSGPLTDPAVRRLYERIIDETRSLERHLYAGEGEE